MNKLKVASLFAGIGGICKGFKNAGFDLAWANEIDKNAAQTYRLNFEHKLIEDDIHNLTSPEKIKELEYVDVITSGFPCQAFSIAGHRKGFEDPRGNLFFETAKIIDQIKPKAFLLENVKNLASHDSGNTLKEIKRTITDDLNYSFIPFVLNTKEYGGIPQIRERIYIVGFKDEGSIKPFGNLFDIYSQSKEVEYRKFVNSRQYSSLTKKFVIPEPLNVEKSIHDFLEKGNVEECFFYDSFPNLEKLRAEMISSETLYQWRRHYVRENKSNACPTLTANMGTGGHNVPLFLDDRGIRKLTPRECFNFQGFSDIRLPKIANSHLYKQAGNSVTVSVVERIAISIKKALSEV